MSYDLTEIEEAALSGTKSQPTSSLQFSLRGLLLAAIPVALAALGIRWLKESVLPHAPPFVWEYAYLIPTAALLGVGLGVLVGTATELVGYFAGYRPGPPFRGRFFKHLLTVCAILAIFGALLVVLCFVSISLFLSMLFDGWPSLD